MAFLLEFVLLGLSVRLIFAAETRTCKYNEYTVESESGNLTCLTCHTCPAGFGLFRQCGTKIKENEKKNECKQCLLGKTYSAHEDISSCKPCGTCSDHQMMVKKCTLYSDSQCNDTCSKGFYFEVVTGDCQPCSWCCADGSIKVTSGCKDMPFYKQCDVNTGKKCKPNCQDDQYVVPGTKGGGYCKNCEVCSPGMSPFPECGSVVENINNISCRKGKAFVGLLAGSLAGAIVFIVLVVLGLWWKFCRNNGTSGSNSSLMPPEEKASVPLVNLVNDHIDVVEKIFQRLDTRIKRGGHYEVIAKYYGYDDFQIKSGFEKADGSPSRAMTVAIVTRDPDITVERFAKVVEKKARRRDVAKLLRAYDLDSQKSV